MISRADLDSINSVIGVEAHGHSHVGGAPHGVSGEHSQWQQCCWVDCGTLCVCRVHHVEECLVGLVHVSECGIKLVLEGLSKIEMMSGTVKPVLSPPPVLRHQSRDELVVERLSDVSSLNEGWLRVKADVPLFCLEVPWFHSRVPLETKCISLWI